MKPAGAARNVRKNWLAGESACPTQSGTDAFVCQPTGLSCRHERAQAAGPLWGAKLAERFGFDLANPFARDVEFLADLFERVLALAADAEAHADHLLLLGGEGFQDAGGLIANVGFNHGIDRGANQIGRA